MFMFMKANPQSIYSGLYFLLLIDTGYWTFLTGTAFECVYIIKSSSPALNLLTETQEHIAIDSWET